jgi:5-(carboxyamino)imidazole ribonucleotide synthase
LPALVKSRRLGYDGKGQRRVAAPERLAEGELAEELVPFDRELSIVGVRGRDGDTRFWPVGENVHRDGILRVTRVPAGGAPQREAEAICTALMDALDYVGVLAVELFEVGGRLLANEFAPRVHNTAHWTIDAAATSQFENHLRAILGLPLGSTDARSPCVMVNLIGSVPPLGELLELPRAHVHLYGKDPREGRKVGHVTLVDPDAETTARAVALAGAG